MKHKPKKDFSPKTMTLYFFMCIILASSFLGFTFYRGIENEKNAYYNDIKSRVKATVAGIEEQFSLFDSISTLLIDSSWIRQVSSMSEIILSEVDYFRRMEICDILNGYNRITVVTDSVALILPDKNEVIDKVSIWEDANRYFRSVGIKDDSFLNKLTQLCRDSSGAVLLPIADGRLFYAKPIRAYQNTEQIFAFLINKSRFAKAIKKTADYPLASLTVDFRSDQVFSLEENSTERNTYDFTIDSIGVPCSFHLVVNNHFSVSNTLKTSMYLISALGIVFSLLLAYTLATLNYKPIKNLLGQLKIEPNNDAEAIDEIIRQFDLQRNEQTNLRKIANDYFEVAKNNILFLLLHGTFNRTINDDTLEMFSLPFRRSPDYVFLVATALFGNQANSKTITVDSIRLQCFLNEKNIPCIVINSIENELIVIFYVKESESSQPASAAFNIYTNILRKYINTCIGSECFLGFPHHGITGISKSYQESLQEQIAQETGNNFGYYYPLDWEIQIIQQARFGNTEPLVKIIKELMKENLSRFLPDVQHEQVILLVRETLRRVAADLLIEFDTKADDKEHSPEEQWKQLIDLAKTLCHAISGGDALSEGDEIGQLIRKFIDEHFRDPNLSQKMLSEYFHMSSPNISKAFKASVGINYINYLQNMRSKYAKEQFDSGNHDIHAVSELSGFSNDVTFRRSFFQSYAITPHQYILQIND